MRPELVSVVIPTYNRAYTLKRALDSVLLQDYEMIEIIIVDDASSDDTQSLLLSYKDQYSNITIVSNKKNLGVGAARNRGMLFAKGEYIAFLDSDDEWILRDKISMQVNFLDTHRDYGFISTAWQTMASGVDQHNSCFIDDASFRKIALRRYPAHTSTWLFRKSVFLKIGGFWSHRAEDYEYLLRIGTITKCYNIPIITENYYNSPSGDYGQHMFLSFFVGLYICIKYSLRYDYFVTSFFSRIFRGFNKSIKLFFR